VLFMVIERFRNKDAAAVYRRFREKGRMLPDGLRYVNSWVTADFDRCFQLMGATTRDYSSSGSPTGLIWQISRSLRSFRRRMPQPGLWNRDWLAGAPALPARPLSSFG
jgi:hypothetical protein